MMVRQSAISNWEKWTQMTNVPCNKVVTMDESSLLDEQAAAAVVAALGYAPHDNLDEHGAEHESNHETSNHATGNRSYQQEALLPYPFFYYRDYSQEVDPDPYTPLTPAGECTRSAFV
jgi:hypothetical protein